MKQSVIMKYLFVAVMLSATALSAVTVQAATFRGVVGLGFDLGGDTLVTAVYTDGSTTDVKANQGLVLNGGVVMVTGSFETQATVGYKFGGPTAKNGSITFDVVPVELMEFYRTSNLRMGAGFTYHNSPKLVIDIPGTSATYKFDNALGAVAQIGWAPEKSSFSIDLRYTVIKYKQSNIANPVDISGNAVGLYLGYYF